MIASSKFTARYLEVKAAERTLAARTSGMGAGVTWFCPRENQILLCKRSRLCDEPLTWACLGGGVEVGESPEEGALRECWEEGGVKFDTPLVLAHEARSPGFTFYNYVGVVPYTFRPVLNDEHIDFRWASFGELPSPLLPAFAPAIPAIRRICRSISAQVPYRGRVPTSLGR